MLSLLLLAPLAGLIILNLPYRTSVKRVAVAFGLMLSIFQVIVAVARPPGFWIGGSLGGFPAFDLAADSLSKVLVLTVGLVVLAAILVARKTISDDRKLSNFLNVLLLAMIGMNGTALVRDLFSLYVFLEITSVCSFILIAMDRGRNALEGAFKYLILSAVASVLMVASVSLVLLLAGGTSFEVVAKAMKSPDHLLTRIAVGGFVCGLLIKGGLVPFHGWVLGAYSAAPAAVSVLLAGIATKASGVYALIRLCVSVFGPNEAIGQVLLAVGALTMVVGALAALGQTDLKRLLAYSSVSQVGYIVLALGCALPWGLDNPVRVLAMIGAVFHFFNHAVFKSLLFANSAALEDRLGTTDMTKMGGLGSRMRLTGTTSVLAALSTAGIPPLAGFWSKLIIIVALWQGHYYIYAALAVAVSLLTLAYMLSMQRKIFFGQTPPELQDVHEVGTGLALPQVILAAITVGVGAAIPVIPTVLDALKAAIANIH